MSRNKKISLFVFILIVIFFSLSFARFLYERNVKNTVLNLLKENFKFCSISKASISFGKGKFWLMCNGRPFYTAYQNGKLVYELNGWGFLKETEHWEELKNCDVYRVKKGMVSFFCPSNLSGNVKLNYFEFSDSFLLKKLKEENFFERLIEDLKVVRPFISNCNFESFEAQAGRVEEPLITMNFRCDDGNYAIATTLRFVSPAIYLTESQDENSIKKAFEKTFGVTPEIDGLVASYDFGGWKIALTYPTEPEARGITMKISLKDKNYLPEVVKNFVPFFEGDLRFLKKETKTTQVKEPPIFTYDLEYYLSDDKILKVYIMDENIAMIRGLLEGFYEKE